MRIRPSVHQQHRNAIAVDLNVKVNAVRAHDHGSILAPDPLRLGITARSAHAAPFLDGYDVAGAVAAARAALPPPAALSARSSTAAPSPPTAGARAGRKTS